jgi:chemotaxis protein MotB
MATHPAAAGDRRPIIIKRRKIVAGGHHGGAWKVAYADFVTAMMAFFMVMWLVSTVSKEQRAALFDYFQNPSMEPGKAPKPAPGQAGPGGASTSPINLRGGLDAPRTYSQTPDIGGPVAQLGAAGPAQMDPTEAQKIAEAAERKQLDALMQDLKEAIAKSQALAPFKDQLLLDITPEGLRIQIVDAQNRAMFDLGSSSLKSYTDQILRELSPYLSSVPNRISLTGHTDTTPYASKNGYTNWELSADRANAARRALEAGGLGPDKVARVVGLSSAVLFDKAQPRAAVNRRISIIVMTRRAEEAALKTDVPLTIPGTDGASTSTEPGTEPAGATTGTKAVSGAIATAVAGTATAAAAEVVPMATTPLPPATQGTPNWVKPVPRVAPPVPTVASAQETAAAARAVLEKSR